jgi:hypothetical protein
VLVSNLNHVKLFASFCPGRSAAGLDLNQRAAAMGRQTRSFIIPAKADKSFPFWLTGPISCR